MWKTLKPLLPKARRSKRHHRAAPYKEIPGIVWTLHAKREGADTAVNQAAEFIILTAVRTSEALCSMRVGEVDFAERLWTIPAERMKTEDDPEGTDFEVPLSDPAIAILKTVIPKGARSDAFVFAGQWSIERTKPLGQNAVLHALKAIYPAMTTHGCRSSFRDWAGDETHFERDIAVTALAHKVGDEVEQAYRRGTALKKRRRADARQPGLSPFRRSLQHRHHDAFRPRVILLRRHTRRRVSFEWLRGLLRWCLREPLLVFHRQDRSGLVVSVLPIW